MDLFEISDEELVRKILSGDKDQYKLIVDRYGNKLERYIRSIVGKSHDTEDILQNVFIKAYKNLSAFDRKLKFSSWIYRIAHNESVNYIKSSLVQKVTVFGEWFDFGQYDLTEEKIDREMARKQITKCMENLDYKYKEPLILYYMDDKSYEEISDILRIPVRAVGVRIHRAKEQMRRLCYGKK